MKDSELTSQQVYSEFRRIFPGFADWVDTELDQLAEFIPAGAAVLDVGCGWGRGEPAVAKSASHVVGLDSDPTEIEQALVYTQNIAHVSYVLADAICTPFKSQTFDVVMTIGNTFGNFADDQQPILNEMLRVVKPGGCVLISVFSDTCTAQRVKCYEQLGIRVNQVEGSRITFASGYISEGFSMSRLEAIGAAVGVRSRVVRVHELGHLLVLGG